jgi:hypothetical protein
MRKLLRCLAFAGIAFAAPALTDAIPMPPAHQPCNIACRIPASPMTSCYNVSLLITCQEYWQQEL